MTLPALALLAAALAALPVAARAQGSHAPGRHQAQAAPPAAVVRAGALALETPWLRATPGGAKVAAGYLRVTNTGAEPDRLVGGSLPGAGRVEVHRTTDENGVARMRPVEGGLAIPPGATVELAPGGHHVMFMDLQLALKAGETVAGALVFEKAGTVAVDFAVRPVGAGAAGHRH